MYVYREHYVTTVKAQERGQREEKRGLKDAFVSIADSIRRSRCCVRPRYGRGGVLGGLVIHDPLTATQGDETEPVE